MQELSLEQVTAECLGWECDFKLISLWNCLQMMAVATGDLTVIEVDSRVWGQLQRKHVSQC